MNQITPILSRRRLLQAGSAVLVSFSAGIPLRSAAAAGRPPLTPDQLDSFIALQPRRQRPRVLRQDGSRDRASTWPSARSSPRSWTLLRPPPSTWSRAIPRSTVNQGGASGSTGIEKGGVTLRFAAAEARRVLLLDRASQKLSRARRPA